MTYNETAIANEYFKIFISNSLFFDVSDMPYILPMDIKYVLIM